MRTGQNVRPDWAPSVLGKGWTSVLPLAATAHTVGAVVTDAGAAAADDGVRVVVGPVSPPPAMPRAARTTTSTATTTPAASPAKSLR
jgi:hypothetical protein